LIAKKGSHYVHFRDRLEGVLNAHDENIVDDAKASDLQSEFITMAVDIVRRERAASVKDPGVWREICIGLGFIRDPLDLT
jgi:hypothetical protein